MKDRKQILVIEDNPADSRIVGVYLRQESITHDFHHCSTLKEAIEIIEKVTPDVIFLDLHLPDSDIVNTLNTIFDKFSKFPVIVMTGSTDSSLTQRAIKLGAQDYLIKGQFNSKRLKTVLELSLGRHKIFRPLRDDSALLKSLREQIKDVEEMAKLGKWSIDLVNNKMEWSDQIYKIFGLTPGMIHPSKENFIKSIRYEDKQKVNDAIRLAERSTEKIEIEFVIYTNGTQIKYLKSSFQIKIDEVARQSLIIGFVQDITEQKKSEELMAKQNLMDKSAQTNKKILHDLEFQINTPLAAMFSYLNLLMKNNDIGESAQKDLESLQGTVQELQKAINNSLNFSILSSPELEINEKEFRFDSLLENIENLVNVKRIEKNIDFDLELPPENSLTPVIGDEKKINQIIFNAIENAIKYNDENGKVTVTLTQEEVDREHCKVVVTVQDNGFGISKEDLEDLMNSKALISLDEKENKALGVPIMNKLTEIMSGDLQISSIEDEGTTVTFAVTLKKGTPGQKGQGDKPSSTLKILYVEDHSLMKIATKKTLENWSEFVKIETAGNGQQGVDKYMADGNFDMILMDLQMPVMDGFEASAILREMSTVPIIAVTANSDPQERDRCLEIGMSDYLQKPFNPEELYAMVMKWINPE